MIPAQDRLDARHGLFERSGSRNSLGTDEARGVRRLSVLVRNRRAC